MISRNLTALRNRSWSERILLSEALFWLAVARLSVLVIPFRYITPLLGDYMSVTSCEVSPAQNQSSLLVGRSVRVVARHIPWYSNCLTQAIAAKMMLRIRGIPSTLYLGVTLENKKDLHAHAWLRSGDLIITGGGNQHRFKVLSTFGSNNKNE